MRTDEVGEVQGSVAPAAADVEHDVSGPGGYADRVACVPVLPESEHADDIDRVGVKRYRRAARSGHPVERERGEPWVGNLEGGGVQPELTVRMSLPGAELLWGERERGVVGAQHPELEHVQEGAARVLVAQHGVGPLEPV